VPLSEPQFLLGAIFVLFVFFAPGGIAGLVVRRRVHRASAATLLSAFKKT
jgi:branched-chain amino acid transport system permease protein